MKASRLIKLLRKSIKDHGDLDVNIIDSEDGSWVSIKSLYKIYPNGADGCCDRTKPVKQLGVQTHDWPWSDLPIRIR